jgi:diguanylate cyclase (GGDEF)-like protein
MSASPVCSLVAPSGDALPRPDALPGLATAVLILTATHEVEYANPSASQLFALDPTGRLFTTLFPSADAGGRHALELALGASPASLRLPLADGRIVACSLRPLSGGARVVSLDDVSHYVREAAQASRDRLTGLCNRAGFQDRLGEALLRAQRTGTACAILCIDLDRFKAVNDTLGHPVGDALLCKVAERLLSASREADVVARLGGDEFAIIQPDGLQPRAAEALAARLVDLLGRTYVASGHMLNIGASIGVAVSSTDGADADTLLKNADLALYRAKGEGRGMFRFFETGMDESMQARRALEIDLRRALALKQFHLAYQPQVALDDDAITGFEALLRWRHPERGMVSPADFIPLAEEIGIINAIGEWVLRTACREAASWPRPVSIAVNLSPVQFRGAKLTAMVTSALAQSGLDPGRLELEITEGALLENTDKVLSVLHAVKALGVRISMDDFGTGYSSLSYLQKFPFDKIKIDQSFVRGMEDSQDCRAIVRAVTGLGVSLGIQTTAEGVETPEQLAHIRAEGCTQVQGYLTGRPLPAAEAAALLAKPPHSA